MTTSRSAM